MNYPEAKKISDTETQYIPVQVFDGTCPDHFLTYQFTDTEGIAHARCAHCPMGSLYDPQEFEIREGRIERILLVN